MGIQREFVANMQLMFLFIYLRFSKSESSSLGDNPSHFLRAAATGVLLLEQSLIARISFSSIPQFSLFRAP